MGAPGEDLLLSPKARIHFPFAVECANQEALNIWAKLEQTMKRGPNGLLVFKRNHSPEYVALTWARFVELVKHADQRP